MTASVIIKRSISSLTRTVAFHSRAKSPTTTTRTMSNSVKQQDYPVKEWLVVVPDQSGALQKRQATKAAHIEGAMSLVNGGQLPYFGVTLAKHQSSNADGEYDDINGSVMVIRASNKESIQGFLERDAYSKAGVWDVNGAQIFPFKSG